MRVLRVKNTAECQSYAIDRDVCRSSAMYSAKGENF